MKAALAVIDEGRRQIRRRLRPELRRLHRYLPHGGADFALVTVGGMTGAARDVIDELREAGLKAGRGQAALHAALPAERVKEALAGVKGFAAVDRSVSFGWDATLR